MLMMMAAVIVFIVLVVAAMIPFISAFNFHDVGIASIADDSIDIYEGDRITVNGSWSHCANQMPNVATPNAFDRSVTCNGYWTKTNLTVWLIFMMEDPKHDSDGSFCSYPKTKESLCRGKVPAITEQTVMEVYIEHIVMSKCDVNTTYETFSIDADAPYASGTYSLYVTAYDLCSSMSLADSKVFDTIGSPIATLKVAPLLNSESNVVYAEKMYKSFDTWKGSKLPLLSLLPHVPLHDTDIIVNSLSVAREAINELYNNSLKSSVALAAASKSSDADMFQHYGVTLLLEREDMTVFEKALELNYVNKTGQVPDEWPPVPEDVWSRELPVIDDTAVDTIVTFLNRLVIEAAVDDIMGIPEIATSVEEIVETLLRMLSLSLNCHSSGDEAVGNYSSKRVVAKDVALEAVWLRQSNISSDNSLLLKGVWPNSANKSSFWFKYPHGNPFPSEKECSLAMFSSWTNSHVHMSNELPTRPVISFSLMDVDVDFLAKPITLKIPLSTRQHDLLNSTADVYRQCVWWNGDVNEWDSSGCYPLEQDRFSTTCQCNHLTDFSVQLGREVSPSSPTSSIRGGIIGLIVSLCVVSAVIGMVVVQRGLKRRHDSEKDDSMEMTGSTQVVVRTDNGDINSAKGPVVVSFSDSPLTYRGAVEELIRRCGIEVCILLDETGFGIMHHAAMAGDTDTVEAVVFACMNSGNMSDFNNDAVMLDTLATYLNYPDSQGRSALTLAALHGQHHIIQYLVVSGAYVDGAVTMSDRCSSDRTSLTPLIAACSKNYVECVDVLLQCLADVNVSGFLDDEIHVTPLLAATANSNSLKCVKLLINAGADVNISDSRSVTPLHQAVQLGELDVVENLIKSGADVDRLDYRRRSAIHWAAATNGLEMARLLVHSNCHLDAQNDIGETPLYCAVREGSEDMVQFLLDSGASKAVGYQAKKSPVELARSHGRQYLLALLVGTAAASAGTSPASMSSSDQVLPSTPEDDITTPTVKVDHCILPLDDGNGKRGGIVDDIMEERRKRNARQCAAFRKQKAQKSSENGKCVQMLEDENAALEARLKLLKEDAAALRRALALNSDYAVVDIMEGGEGVGVLPSVISNGFNRKTEPPTDLLFSSEFNFHAPGTGEHIVPT